MPSVLFYDIDTQTNRLHRDHCHSRKSLGKEVAMCPNRGGVDVIKQYTYRIIYQVFQTSETIVVRLAGTRENIYKKLDEMKLKA